MRKEIVLTSVWKEDNFWIYIFPNLFIQKIESGIFISLAWLFWSLECWFRKE